MFKLSLLASIYTLFLLTLLISGCTTQTSQIDAEQISPQPNESQLNLSTSASQESTQNTSFINNTNPLKNPYSQNATETISHNNTLNQIPNSALTKPQKTWYQPTPNTSWQWQLTGDINTNYPVQMYDVDLFETPISTIQLLKNRGIKVICYFSAGTYEPYRPDSHLIPKSTLGSSLEDWPDERWLDITKIEQLTPIITSRLDLAKQKGCDGVEPDNVDGYQNDHGFDLTYEDQIEYNLFLAHEAHKRNLAVGLKNDLNQIPELVFEFDFAINEQCFEYDECDQLLPFINQNKAVFGVEYELSKNEFCSQANKLNFDWLKMDYELDGKRDSCR